MTDKALEAVVARLGEMARMRSVPSVLTRAGREFIAEKSISAYLSALPGEAEVVGWSYELAARKLGGYTGIDGYASFRKHLSDYKPTVPDGALRNLEPLVRLSDYQTLQAENARLRKLAALATIRTAERHPARCGPWLFDEETLQERAKEARKFLEQTDANG